MELHLDGSVLARWGPFHLNSTLLMTWMVMLVLTLLAWAGTRRISVDSPSRLQGALEALVGVLRQQVREVLACDPDPYLPFLGGLFLFISTSALLTLVPGFHAPTASLSTTGALAVCVLVAVPVYGIARQGPWGYLRGYFRPNPLMFPFHVLGEATRTLSLAVRLFGNMASSAMIVGLLLSLAPLLFPVVMQIFELLLGQVQAYIFAILATVYVASGLRAHEGRPT